MVAAVRRMSSHMRARGPDADGEWLDNEARFCMGHRRLSILDLNPRSDQPMISQDGRYAIVFNGEIYNFRELRTDLEKEGVAFQTTSDTEVILELFARKGSGMLLQLRGMFAIGIWDLKLRSLFLARDPYGIKPLYIAQSKHGVLFASQVKALLATGVVSRARDFAGIAGFHLWGSVPEPFTIYQDIRAVPSGSFILVDTNGPSAPVQYADVYAALQTTEDASDVKIGPAIKDSIQAHLVADVPIALFLSGGVDSGLIGAMLSELSHPVVGITIAFQEFSGKSLDEGQFAKRLAEQYNFKSIVRNISREEFYQDIPAIFDAMDQPSIDGVNTWFAAKAAAESGYKIALSGIGADELFCGYSTFRSVPRLSSFSRLISKLMPPKMSHALFGLAAKGLDTPKIAAIPKYSAQFADAYRLRRGLLTPDELGAVMNPDAAREGINVLALSNPFRNCDIDHRESNILQKVAALEAVCYLRNQLLRDSDWASMAHSLELRTPFVDWNLARTVAPIIKSLGNGRGKRELLEIPSKPFPQDIANRRKVGFNLPLSQWLPKGATSLWLQPWARNWSCIVAEEFGLHQAT